MVTIYLGSSMVIKDTSNKIILKRFIAFLKQNGAYKIYLNNISRERGVSESTLFIKSAFNIWEDYKGKSLISRAFSWSTTEEGYAFWRTLHYKWTYEAVNLKKLYENDIEIIL